MKKIKVAVLLPFMLGLTACGGDSDDQVIGADEPPTPQIDNSAWNYVETPYMELPPYHLEGEVNVVVGTLDDQIQPWVGLGIVKAFQGDLSHDINGDGSVNPADAKLATPEIQNTESGPVFRVSMEDMITYLATNPDGLGAGSSRPDIFKPGAYSSFDLLRYMVGTREDMRWEGGVESILTPEESAYDTYEYRISWDMNGDGKFDSNDGDYFNSANWHYALKQSLGQNKQYAGARLAVQYSRMDQYWLREEQSYRFTVYSDEMINRLHWVWKQEQQRLANNGGKFIIPFVFHFDLNEDFSNPPSEILATNLEVTAHNMRSDVFQEGVLSTMDVWLSLADQTGADIRFTWWPTMSSGAKVDGFTIMHTPWTGNYGGWFAGIPFQGELATNGDFSGSIPTCNFNKDGSTTFNEDGTIGVAVNPVDPVICIKEWSSYNAIGGNQVNNIVGNTIMSYPYQFVGLGSIQGEPFRNGTDLDLQKDDTIEVYMAENELQHTAQTLGVKGEQSLFPTEDVTGIALLRPMHAATKETKIGSASILDESHFGWKIADCTQCHKKTFDNKLGHGGQPWPVNSVDGFDYMQPYYCATCHGSNGAPQGHNRAARCFWCHNTNNKNGLDRLWMDKHADASLPKFIPASKNVANQLTRVTVPVDREGELSLYGDLWSPSHNSDFALSKTFPDPYSCGTCHGFEHEIEPKVEE